MKHYLLSLFCLISIAGNAAKFLYVDSERGTKIHQAIGFVEDLSSGEIMPLKERLDRVGRFRLIIQAQGYHKMTHILEISSDQESDYTYLFNLNPVNVIEELNHDFISRKCSHDHLQYQVSVVDDVTRFPMEGVVVYDKFGNILGESNLDGILSVSLSHSVYGDKTEIRFQKEGYFSLVSTELIVSNIYQKKIVVMERGVGDKFSFELDYYANQSKNDQIEIQDVQSIGMLSGNYPVCDITTVEVGYQNSSLSTCPNPSTQSCSYVCGYTQVFTLDDYTKKVLPMEWLISWELLPNISNAYRAGAVAIRTFASWFVLHPLNSSYDICSSTCCQAIGTSTYSITNSAVNETSGYFLWDFENDEEARSEYTSEGNNLNPSDTDNCDCISNTCGCGNGYIGRSNTGSPCFSDPVGLNHEGFGHGRGMSQFGTARWASGLNLSAFCGSGSQTTGPSHGYGTKTWQQILDHYYGDYYSLIQCSSSAGQCNVQINQFLVDPPVCGETILLNLAIQNTSGFTMNNPTVNYYMTTTDPNSGILVCSSQGSGSALLNNGYMGFPCEIDPFEQPCGDYSICYILSSNECPVAEIDCVEIEVPCDCSIPDIEVTDIYFTSPPVFGQTVQLCVEVTNVGNGTPFGDTDLVEIQIGQNTTFQSADGPVLDPGESTLFCVNYLVNETGVLDICAFVEQHSEEENLNNNSLCIEIIVGAPNCALPSSLVTTNITSTTAVLDWSQSAGADTYSVQYRLCGATTWIDEGNTPASLFNLSFLECGQCYEWRIRSNCAAQSSGWVNSQFSTTACGCDVPTGLTTTSATQESILLSWTSVSGAVQYGVQFKVCSSSEWSNEFFTSQSSLPLNGLLCSQCYDFRIRTDCGNNNQSAYSVGSFNTLSCTCLAPTSINAIQISDSEFQVTWQGSAQTFSLQYRICGGLNWQPQIPLSSSQNSMIISGLECGQCYQFRVLSNCSNGASSGYAFSNQFGLICSCEVPDSIEANEIASDYVEVSWSPITSALGYDVRYKICGQLDWLGQINVSIPSLIIEGLSCETCYTIEVRSDCSDAQSDFSNALNLTTASCMCDVPEQLSSFNASQNAIQLDWNSSLNTNQYILQYKCCSDLSWLQIPNVILGSNYYLEGLSCNSCYSWRVRENCDDSDWSFSSEFTTMNSLGCLSECSEVIGLVELTEEVISIEYFQDEIFITNHSNEDVELSVFAVNGQLIKASTRVLSGEEVKHNFGESLSHGIYVIRVVGDEFLMRKKIVIER